MSDTALATLKQWVEESHNIVFFGGAGVSTESGIPDFRSEELCKAYGVMDPLEVPGRMLLAGEYERLSREILSLSGFDDDLEEQAKN